MRSSIRCFSTTTKLSSSALPFRAQSWQWTTYCFCFLERSSLRTNSRLNTSTWWTEDTHTQSVYRQGSLGCGGKGSYCNAWGWIESMLKQLWGKTAGWSDAVSRRERGSLWLEEKGLCVLGSVRRRFGAGRRGGKTRGLRVCIERAG